MSLFGSKKSLIITFLFLVTFFICSCQSTKNVSNNQNDLLEVQAPSSKDTKKSKKEDENGRIAIKICEDVPAKISESKKILENTNKDVYNSKTKYRYIFIRLYDPDYTNPFYPANILKAGIASVEVNPEHKSHSSININLSDDFYGLTSGGKYQLDKESCENYQANKYLKNCNPVTSTQTTYAFLVTEEEYNNLHKELDAYLASPDIKYSIPLNFKIATFSIKRKNLKNEEQKQFGNCVYPKEKEKKEGYVENDFVCSTFIAYILYKNVSSVKKFFDDNKINFQYVMVSDLAHIPGVVELFSSSYDEYDEAVAKFVENYSQFDSYYQPVEKEKNIQQSGTQKKIKK